MENKSLVIKLYEKVFPGKESREITIVQIGSKQKLYAKHWKCFPLTLPTPSQDASRTMFVLKAKQPLTVHSSPE